ncbi:MAG TPA: PepSY-like domain-containing protein [Bacteroidia bacterium]|jgi:hypothetical protein
MKKAFFLITAVLLSGNIIAQAVDHSTVPENVISALNKAYLNPPQVKWEMDYDNYIGKFERDKVEVAVTYNKDAVWLMTEIPVSHKSLPAAVKSCLTKQFDIYKENDIERVDKPAGVCYQIDLEYNQKTYEVLISESGELVKREEVKEYKKE